MLPIHQVVGLRLPSGPFFLTMSKTAANTRRLLILFGSETGCAQETAERIEREAKQRHFTVDILPMNEYAVQNLPLETLVCFVCSVTGQGEVPGNMKEFWHFLLRKSLPKDSLSNMNFGVFGQGDSSYREFNYPAKKLFNRLKQLGGKNLVRRGDGDDQHYLGVDGALDPWLSDWWNACLNLFPLEPGLEIISEDTLIPCSINFKFLDLISREIQQSCGSIVAEITKNERLTPENHFQDVRHITMHVDGAHKMYVPGDVLIVYPQNLSQKVQQVLDFFGWSKIADNLIEFSMNSNASHINSRLCKPISLRNLLECHLDIFGRPRRHFFKLLSFFATDNLQRDKLLEFASAQGQSDLYAYCHKPKRTYFEVFQDFNSVKFPIEYLFDLIPYMRPRKFSISSSPTVFLIFNVGTP
jgi:sulfite reductase alpha subunit-like flavoprotein